MLVPAPEIGLEKAMVAREVGLIPRQAELSTELERGDDDERTWVSQSCLTHTTSFVDDRDAKVFLK